MKLRGKGYYIWQVQNCEGGSAKAIASKAQQAGLTHVLIKIADGASWAYNIDRTRDVDLVPPVLTALKSAGIQVWGWHYVRGDNPLGEARLGANRARSLGLDGYVIDAEREYKGSGKKAAAQRYAQELRRLLGNMPIALSSYRYPEIDYEIPYGEFLAVCDFAMPQVYFEHSHDPEVQLRRSLDQYMSLPNARPVVPTFPTYSVAGWRPTADEVRLALSTAKDLGTRGRQRMELGLRFSPGVSGPLERDGRVRVGSYARPAARSADRSAGGVDSALQQSQGHTRARALRGQRRSRDRRSHRGRP